MRSAAAVGLACYLGLIPFDPATLRFEGIVRRHLEIMTGAGIVAGVVYWMIAGRNAGAWREPPPAAATAARCRHHNAPPVIVRRAFCPRLKVRPVPSSSSPKGPHPQAKPAP